MDYELFWRKHFFPAASISHCPISYLLSISRHVYVSDMYSDKCPVM